MWFWAHHACHALMIITAAVASVTDLRSGVIPNRLVSTALLAALTLHGVIALTLAGWLPLGAIPDDVTLAEVLTLLAANASFGIVVSVALYGFKLWSAGDAKLAIALAVAQPAWIGLGGPVPWAPFLVVLGNALVVGVVFVSLEVIVRGGPILWRGFVEVARARRWPVSRRGLGNIARIALAVAALATALGPVRQWAGALLGAQISGGTFLAFLLVFIAYRPLVRLSRTWSGVIGAGCLFVASAVWSIWQSGEAGVHEVGSSLVICAAVMIGRGVLGASSRTFDSRAIGPEELKPEMVLADSFLDRLEADTRWREAFAEIVGSLRGVKLDQNLIDNVLEWHRHNAPDEKLGVRTPLPFAPALALGVVLTVAVGRLIFQSSGGVE